MNMNYACWIFLAVLAGFLCMWSQCRHLRTAAVATLTAFAAGLCFAKLVYVVLNLQSTLLMDGLMAFADWRASQISMFGGMAGAVLGAWLGAKLLARKPGQLLDCFVPCAAIALAFLRAGEKALGTIGVGDYLPADSWMARFPFAVTNAYGEYLYAVFYLEALLAFVCGAALLMHGKKWPEGVRTRVCLFGLALAQILCESLRARCMKWGFVRVEQLLCAVLVFVLIFLECRKAPPSRFRWVPAAVCGACIAVVALMEYALDKLDIPVWGCYLIMMAALAGIAVAFAHVLCRRYRNR